MPVDPRAVGATLKPHEPYPAVLSSNRGKIGSMQRLFRILRTSVAVVVLLLATSTIASGAKLQVTADASKQELSPADLQKLQRAQITISDHGTTATFEGIEVWRLLSLVNVPAGEKLRGSELMKYVVVEGADGYRALFALPELDSAFSHRKVILADMRDGKPLSEKEGPFRVIVESEKRQARCVRQVVRIAVVSAQ